MAFKLTSTVFQEGGTIPSKYTCDGQDVSPPLAWEGEPSGTQSFVLICDDPDAPMGTWDHWILFNIPASIHSLDENIQSLPSGTLVGKNSWGRETYGGPCPPDKRHTYVFRLFALSQTLDLPQGATKQDVLKALETCTLGEAVLKASYDLLKRQY